MGDEGETHESKRSFDNRRFLATAKLEQTHICSFG